MTKQDWINKLLQAQKDKKLITFHLRDCSRTKFCSLGLMAEYYHLSHLYSTLSVIEELDSNKECPFSFKDLEYIEWANDNFLYTDQFESKLNRLVL